MVSFSRFYSDALTQSQCHQFSLLLSFLKFLTALLSRSSSVLSALFLLCLRVVLFCFRFSPPTHPALSGSPSPSSSSFLFFVILSRIFFFVFCHPTHTVDRFFATRSHRLFLGHSFTRAVLFVCTSSCQLVHFFFFLVLNLCQSSI